MESTNIPHLNQITTTAALPTPAKNSSPGVQIFVIYCSCSFLLGCIQRYFSRRTTSCSVRPWWINDNSITVNSHHKCGCELLHHGQFPTPSWGHTYRNNHPHLRSVNTGPNPNRPQLLFGLKASCRKASASTTYFRSLFDLKLYARRFQTSRETFPHGISHRLCS